MNLPKIFFLETERIILRQLNSAVFNYLYNNGSDDEIALFLNLKNNEELETEKTKFKNGLTTFRLSFCNFQLIEKLTNEIIGDCGYHTWYLQHKRAEIGYALTDDSKKQKGFMAEALKPIIIYGFDVMNLNRIEAFASINNIASVKLLQRHGFIYEANLREHYFKDNKVEDSVVFGLLRNDWKQL